MIYLISIVQWYRTDHQFIFKFKKLFASDLRYFGGYAFMKRNMNYSIDSYRKSIDEIEGL
ncbi:unnamed protein product [Paramecium primaurelia]|uniref:Uncharacterized protein n=1 Tax=Paramecium primaurelia TaxID=5886 RepID=A0A8S1PNK2_PARPR|nr:unnamed protein product [Paramecium primaurelia]